MLRIFDFVILMVPANAIFSWLGGGLLLAAALAFYLGGWYAWLRHLGLIPNKQERQLAREEWKQNLRAQIRQQL